MGEVRDTICKIDERVTSLEKSQEVIKAILESNTKLIWAVFGIIGLGFISAVIIELFGLSGFGG